MLEFDLTNWPVWVIIIAWFLITFRKELSSFLPNAVHKHFQFKASRQRDREEFDQKQREDETAFKHKKELQLIDAQLGEVKEERKQAYVREEQLLKIVEDQNSLLRDLVLVQNQTLEKKLDSTRVELRALKRAVLRTTDLIAFIYTQSMGTNGQTIKEFTDEIGELIDAKDDPSITDD